MGGEPDSQLLQFLSALVVSKNACVMVLRNFCFFNHECNNVHRMDTSQLYSLTSVLTKRLSIGSKAVINLFWNSS